MTYETDVILRCTECAWKAETPEDGEMVLDNGEIISLAHVGCPECGGMLTEVHENE